MTASWPTSKLVQNFLSLSGAEVISKLLTLATFAFVARIVGPGGFGYLEFAFSIVMCGALLVDQGSGVYGAREIARSPNSTTRLVTEVTSLRLAAATGSWRPGRARFGKWAGCPEKLCPHPANRRLCPPEGCARWVGPCADPDRPT